MKVLVASSNTKSLVRFRMDMMKAFIAKGYEVIAIGDQDEKESAIEFQEAGIKYIGIRNERNSVSPLKDLLLLIRLIQIFKRENPSKVFLYHAKTIVYGSIAAKLLGINEIYTLIAGLGSLIRNDESKNKLISWILRIEYRQACRISKRIFVQNPDDLNELIRLGITSIEKCSVINGSGVNLDTFSEVPLPREAAFLYIGRLIRDKGIMEYLEACKILRSRNKETEFLLVGPFDTNPSAIREIDLNPFISTEVIQYFGEQSDVRPFIARCSTIVLPSYHEGTPKTILEAMAMGRSVITTDAPGCRETVINGENGFLVEVKDIEMLVKKMQQVIDCSELRTKMGKRSLEIAKEKYDVRKINNQIMDLMDIGEQR